MAEESKNKLIPTDEVIDAKIVAALEEPLRKISEHDKSLADKAESSSVYDKTTVDSKVKVLGDAVAEHVANNTRHISDSEREIWNNKPDSSEIYTRQQSDLIFASFSHEHTNDGWFVSVINAVKKLIPALPSWLTPTREEPPTKEEVASKADKSAFDAHIEKTDNPHGVTAEQVGAVPFVADKDGNKTAVTIGSRLTGIVGPGSIANGYGVYAQGNGSYAAGYNTSAVGDYSRADGSWTEAIGSGSRAYGIKAHTRLEDAYSYAWNGNGDPDYGVYYSHGVGTFNINPIGGLDGFYIGDDKISSILSKKADKITPSANGNLASLTADGNLADSGKKASDFAPADEGGYLPLTGGSLSGKVDGQGWWLDGGNLYVGDGIFLGGDNRPVSIGAYGDAYHLNNAAGYKWFYGNPNEQDNEIAVKGDISAAISATNPTFSNAVLAVQISTNDFAALYALKEAFADLPIDPVTGSISIGALLAALASAVAWLKKNKVGSFASVGGATATVDNGVAKLDDFFTESNSLLNGRLAYSRNATGLKDRAFNALTFDGTEYNLSTALAAVTPTASGQPRDLLIVATATAATTISFTAGTIKGDKPTIDGSGTWLITLTEYASGVWYCRQIKMEDAA